MLKITAWPVEQLICELRRQPRKRLRLGRTGVGDSMVCDHENEPSGEYEQSYSWRGDERNSWWVVGGNCWGDTEGCFLIIKLEKCF
jgi:hypothetical protein